MKIIQKLKKTTIFEKIGLWMASGLFLWVVKEGIALFQPCVHGFFEGGIPLSEIISINSPLLGHILLGPISFFIWTIQAITLVC